MGVLDGEGEGYKVAEEISITPQGLMTPAEARRLAHGRMRELQHEATSLARIVEAMDAVMPILNNVDDLNRQRMKLEGQIDEAHAILDGIQSANSQLIQQCESIKHAITIAKDEEKYIEARVQEEWAARMTDLSNELRVFEDAERGKIDMRLTQANIALAESERAYQDNQNRIAFQEAHLAELRTKIWSMLTAMGMGVIDGGGA